MSIGASFLQEYPLLQRIQRIQLDDESGSLFLKQEGQIITVYFHNGLISAVSTTIREYQLGRFMAKRGYLEEKEILPLIREACKRHTLLGETAVNRNLLDTSELMELVQEQVAHTLVHAARNLFEAHEFRSVAPRDFFIPARIGHMHLILELARNDTKPFRLNPCVLIALRDGRMADSLPWLPAELSVMNELRVHRNLHELSAVTGLDYQHLGKILSVFNSLQLLSFVDSAPVETTALAKRQGFPFELLIPEIPKRALSEKLETARNESSFISEQFKALKVRLAHLASIHGAKVFTISSPSPEEGKSMICLNLAIAYARDQHRRVIVLDCDLRNPTLHKYLGITAEPGLLNYLQQDCLQPYCYMRRLDRLHILTSGGVSTNPLDYLSLDSMRNLIDYLKTEFDTILIDSPPLMPISDAHVLTGLSDGVVLVVRSGKTTYASIEKGLRYFDPGKLTGVVFNDVRAVMFNTQYDYRYYNHGTHHYPYTQRRVGKRSKNYLDI